MTTPKPKGARRRRQHWFRDLRISRKLTIAIVVHLLHATVLLVVTAYGMQALSASRAYVEGEGLWSKAQKTAVLELDAFAETGDESHYDAFLDEINVTLGDRQARMEMDKPSPDLAVVRQGFIAGRLDPEDIGDMIWLYRNFADERHLAAAIDIWALADENITLLVVAAERVHAEVEASGADSAAVRAAMADVHALDHDLTILEEEFSRTLGDGVRWLSNVVTIAAIGLTIPFVGGAVLVSWTVARHIGRSATSLNEGAKKLAAGDLSVRVPSEGKDELALAGQAFNAMADRLEEATRQRTSDAAALRESLERFQALSEGSPLGVFHTDAQGRVDYANARWEEIAGCSYKDAAAVRQAVHPEDQPTLATMWRASLASGRELAAEFRWRHADGTVVQCVTRASPVRDASGALTGFVGIVEDVTQRRIIEARARESERLREEAEFKSSFINTAAHELNTPITPLVLQLTALRQSLGEHPTEQQARSLDVVERNVSRLSRLVADILDGARLEAGHLRLRKRLMAVEGAVHACVQEAAALAAKQGVELSVEVGTGEEAPGTVTADPDRVHQVLMNLVGNAIKFTPAKGSVRLRAERKGGEVVLSVKDSGRGLAEGDAQRLFRPFVQVHDPASKEVGGTGLGLYICKGIVQAHGGRIWCESDGLGKGSTFGFTLPTAAGAGDEDPT